MSGAGTGFQHAATAFANQSVVDHILKLAASPDYTQSCIELSLRVTLSLADAVVLEQRLGINNTARFIDVVDPWCYPGEETRAPCGIKRCFQYALDKVKKADILGFKYWTPVSSNAFLLSPLLVRKRPELVRLSRAAPSGSKSSGHLTDLTHVTAPGACPSPRVESCFFVLLSRLESLSLSV
jgi:hypothetical protein